MNPRLLKEIRLILPLWGMALALAAAPLLDAAWFDRLPAYMSPGDGLHGLPAVTLSYWGALLLVAAGAWGHEFSYGTVAGLLCQPARRSRWIWEKNLVLLVACLSVLAFVLWIQWIIGYRYLPTLARLFPPILFVLGCGPLSGLITRGAFSAFWMLTSIAWAIVFFAPMVVPSGSYPGFSMDIALGFHGLTAIAAFAWTLRRFPVWQDQSLKNTDLNNLMAPRRRTQPRSLPRGDTIRPKTPWKAYLGKELRLHSMAWVAFAIALVMVAGFYVVSEQATQVTRPQDRWADPEVLYWMIAYLSLLLPFLIGATTVSEERRLKTHNANLLLPVRSVVQWRWKMGVALALSLTQFAIVHGTLLWVHHVYQLDSGFLPEDSFSRILLYIGLPILCTGMALAIAPLTRVPLKAVGLAILATGLLAAINLGILRLATFLMALLSGIRTYLPWSSLRYELPDPTWLGPLLFVLTLFFTLCGVSARLYGSAEPMKLLRRRYMKGFFLIGLAILLLPLASNLRIWEFALESSNPTKKRFQSGPFQWDSRQSTLSLYMGPDDSLWYFPFAHLGNVGSGKHVPTRLREPGWAASIKNISGRSLILDRQGALHWLERPNLYEATLEPASSSNQWLSMAHLYDFDVHPRRLRSRGLAAIGSDRRLWIGTVPESRFEARAYDLSPHWATVDHAYVKDASYLFLTDTDGRHYRADLQRFYSERTISDSDITPISENEVPRSAVSASGTHIGSLSGMDPARAYQLSVGHQGLIHNLPWIAAVGDWRITPDGSVWMDPQNSRQSIQDRGEANATKRFFHRWITPPRYRTYRVGRLNLEEGTFVSRN